MNRKTLPISGHGWSFFWNNPLYWAILLSFSLNTAFAYVTLENYTPPQPGAQDPLTIDLLSTPPSWMSEIRRQIAAPIQGKAAALTFVTGTAAQSMFDKVRVGISDPDLDRTLRLIKGTIGTRWDAAEPPSWGKILLVMEVSPDGNIISVGINRVSGPQGLEQFVFDLVKSAGPFSTAMSGRSEPVWVECEFAVEAMEQEV
jgi:hypothetical protein